MRFEASPPAMDAQPEKVYVAVGDDLRDGLATLDWARKTWASNSISMVVLYAANRNSRESMVYTPFGRLPASTASDEVLRTNLQYEQEKAHKLLTQFIAFCGEVKTEVLEMEVSDEPIHELIVDLMSRHRITRFVMSLAFLRASPPWRSKGAISGSFYIHRYKPSYCELRILCGGQLILLEKNEADWLVDDDGDDDGDQGVMATKSTQRMSSRGRLGTLFANSPTNCLTAERSGHGWPDWMMDSYYDQLVSSTAEEEVSGQGNASSPTGDARDMMKIRSEDQVKTYVERSREAERAIRLCNQRAEELKGCIDDETAIRMGVEREVESSKQEIGDLRSDVREAKKRLSETLDLQSGLSRKLRTASLERSRAESRLEAAAIARSEMVREIEDLRRQRDVLHRRIEFCRDKDAIGAAARQGGKLGFRRREFSGEEIRAATDGFSGHRRMSSVGGDDDVQRGVYRGRIDRTTVAIELVGDDGLAREGFREKVNQLISLQHPHVVAMLGFCLEPMCLVFEYMPGGSLGDLLPSSTASNKNSNGKLHWSHYLRIATEVCGGLRFLNSAEPTPIILGDLRPSNILLGHNLVAKVHGLASGALRHNQWQMDSDVRPFGHVLLQLLMWADPAGPELVEQALIPGSMTLSEVVDAAAGDWPRDVVMELAEIGMRCLHVGQGPENDLGISSVGEELNALRKKALNIDEGEPPEAANQEGATSMEDTSNVPSMFLCPIRQKVMRDPHVAADGFSYEKEAIEEWIGKGKNTSPMTNLRLNHTILTPNHTLRPLIHEWIDKKMVTPP